MEIFLSDEFDKIILKSTEDNLVVIDQFASTIDIYDFSIGLCFYLFDDT